MNFFDIYRIAQVVLGIGLVIFVHEAGHFLAARWCGVRVDVFSLGFGPRLFGWRRGKTLYQVAMIPVGGYVKMAGEMSDGSGRRPQPDELAAKNVWQRFFIYSGGVLMNVVFALIVFPLVLAAGVPVNEPVVVPDKGSPAWKVGMLRGTRVLEIDGEEVYDFFHIPNEVALAGHGPITFLVLAPGATEPSRLLIEPIYSENGGFRQIGVRPGVDPSLVLLVDEDGPAARAGLVTGDRLVGVVGAPTVLDPIEQLARAVERTGPIPLRVERDGVLLERTVEPEVTQTDRRFLGVAPLQNVVRDWRPGNPWIERWSPRAGERLIRVDGHSITRPSELLEALLAPGESGLELVFLDDRQSERVLRFDDRPTEAEAAAIDRDLFLDFEKTSTRLLVQPGKPAALAGLRSGDRVVSIGGRPVATWQQIIDGTKAAAANGGSVAVTFEHAGPSGWERSEVSVLPATMNQTYYGFAPSPAKGIYRTDSVMGSISAGMTASWRFLTDAWLTLKKMLTRQVSAENLGGIITIGTVSYSFASEGLAKLFFFLCMLSINLAFLNVLPIPVLDGGHLFFCLVEAVKGSPVSERTLGYSQVVGLVLILTLMVYVTYQDVLRLFT